TEDLNKDVTAQLSPTPHPRPTRDRRTKRPNDGNKACQNHSPSPVLLIKIMRALEVAATEKERVLAAIERCPRRTSNPVTNLVPHYGTQHDWEKQQLQRNDASGRKNARSAELQI